MERADSEQTTPDPVRSRTRLAPSPTGALHLGNAFAFMVNWALARQRGWEIILRIEDLDTPRIKPGTIQQTIDTLGWLGIDWDEGPLVQSDDLTGYRAAIKQLADQGKAYPCQLTRKQIEEAASAPHADEHETAFPQSLRPSSAGEPQAAAGGFTDDQSNWRLIVPDQPILFHDERFGTLATDLAESIGDFVVWTKRGQPSYQLAVVVDDAAQGITHVVRGSDLLGSAARQLAVARALKLEFSPHWHHLPLVRGMDGKRLAKRHGDTRLTTYETDGVPAERIIGLLAHWAGICSRPEPLSAGDFRDAFDPTRVPMNDLQFQSQHEDYLRQ